MIVYPEEIMSKRIKELEAENDRIIRIIKDRRNTHHGFVNGALDAGVDISPSIYTAISELNALLREIEQ
jgi:hypothetical protein